MNSLGCRIYHHRRQSLLTVIDSVSFIFLCFVCMSSVYFTSSHWLSSDIGLKSFGTPLTVSFNSNLSLLVLFLLFFLSEWWENSFSEVALTPRRLGNTQAHNDIHTHSYPLGESAKTGQNARISSCALIAHLALLHYLHWYNSLRKRGKQSHIHDKVTFYQEVWNNVPFFSSQSDHHIRPINDERNGINCNSRMPRSKLNCCITVTAVVIVHTCVCVCMLVCFCSYWTHAGKVSRQFGEFEWRRDSPSTWLDSWLDNSRQEVLHWP